MDGQRPGARRPPRFTSPTYATTSDGSGSSTFKFTVTKRSVLSSTLLDTDPSASDKDYLDVEAGKGKDAAYRPEADGKSRSLLDTQ